MTDLQPRPTTTDAGIPVASDTLSLTVGANGPILLQDHYLIEQMANFNRERIPERQPHAKGHGAFGYFEVTNDVSAFTRAAVFQPGIRTDTLIRFSTVAGERGSADSWRDPRGFALKFYTSEGNSGADDEVEHVLGTAQLEPVPRLGHSVAAGRLGGGARSSVHLSSDPLGLVVDAFDGAVAVRKRERGDHGAAVSVQARVKVCRWGRSAAWTWTIQCESVWAFPAQGVRSWAKFPILLTSWVLSWQAPVSRTKRSRCSVLRLSGLLVASRGGPCHPLRIMILVHALADVPGPGWTAAPTLLECLAVIGVATVLAWHERRTTHPIVPPAVVRWAWTANSFARSRARAPRSRASTTSWTAWNRRSSTWSRWAAPCSRIRSGPGRSFRAATTP